jgi:hypothetical protein
MALEYTLSWELADTDHHRMLAKVRIILGVSKQAAHKFAVEIFNLRKLSELEVRLQYQIKISNGFEALESLNVSEGLNKAWEIIEEDIKTSAT